MKTRSSDTFSPGDADMPAYSDEQLVLEALDDSHLAFEQLVKRYQYRVLRTIASIVSDEHAAQDVAQETFLSAWSDLAKLKEREKFGRWLNRIAINLSKDCLRDQRRHNESKNPLDENAIVLTQELRYRRDKLRQEVWEAINELTEDHREAVILHYISGYSYKEISEMLSIPFSTTVGRIQQARNKLRKEFLDMVTKLQLEIDSTALKFLKEHAKQDGLSVEGLIIRLIERYRRDADTSGGVTRRIRDNVQDFYGAISPDGRYFSYVNWGTNGNLAIQDLETGESRDVTDEGIWEKEWQFADVSTWSPDSKQIAYLWFKGSGFSEPEDESRDTELRIVGIDGSRPRVLYSSPIGSLELLPQAWSRDGKHILALHHKKTDETHNHDFVLVSVADGSIRVLKSLDGHQFEDRMSLSPDGRYVVYDYPQSKDSPDRDIFLLATDGGHETTLVEHPANDFAPFWAPEGDRIVFASDRSGSMGIWVLEVVDGKPKGPPQLISDNLNDMRPLGLTQDGSYYYGLQSRANDIYFADLDPETGKVVKAPTKAVQRFEGLNYSPAFSPDGKRIAYMSQRPEARYVVRSLETGEEHELQPNPSLPHLGHNWRWFPDGCSILVMARAAYSAKETLWGLHQIHVETGAVTHVVWDDEQGSIYRPTPPVFSPDGSKIFFSRRQDDGITTSIRVYDFGTEREWSPDFRSKLGKGYKFLYLALSPDGQQLAFLGRLKDVHSLEIAPSAGGEAREVIRLPEAEIPRYPDRRSWFVWTPDGRYLLFPRLEDKAIELWRIPVQGGKPENLGLTMKKIEFLSVHPDGHRIVFTGPGPRSGNEVWTIENFLQESS